MSSNVNGTNMIQNRVEFCTEMSILIKNDSYTGFKATEIIKLLSCTTLCLVSHGRYKMVTVVLKTLDAESDYIIKQNCC